MKPKLLTVDEALRLVEANAQSLTPTRVALTDALGCVLAEPIASDVDSPPHDKAMMDGYAVRSVDGVVERRVIEEVFAGDVPTKSVGAGEAAKIMTGAPMPEGADAVVPVEMTEQAAGGVNNGVRLLADPPVAGKHVMPRGEAMHAGQTVLDASAVIGSAQVALLAEVGAAAPLVVPRPTVAVLPTGAELVAPGQRPGPGQIRNSNGPMLMAAAREAGAEPIDAGVATPAGAVTDDEGALRRAILAARGADVLLLSGGVSAGDRDLAPGVLAELGVEKVFHKVAVKPGKPLWFGVWPAANPHPPTPNPQPPAPTPHPPTPTLVFGLPGNPVSSFVCFQLFVRPALGVLAGRGWSPLAPSKVLLGDAINHRGGRETYLPARRVAPQAGAIDGRSTVRLTRWRGSADLTGLAAADALIRLPVEPCLLAAGDQVEVLDLPEAGASC